MEGRDSGGAVEGREVAEMSSDACQGFLIPEVPGDDGPGMAELPGGVSSGFSSEKSMQAPPGYAELEPDEVTTQTVVKDMGETSLMPDERKAGSWVMVTSTRVWGRR